MNLPRKKRGETSATLMQTLGLILVCSGVFALTAFASPPAWWYTPGPNGAPSAVVTTSPSNDFAVVNEGQVKQFTVRAVDELNTDLANYGGAGTTLNNQVNTWASDYTNHNYGPGNLKPSDYTAMNVGQLKTIANMIYGRLAAVGYTGLTPSWLHPNSATDGALANLGQLKEVFNFNLSSPSASSLSVSSGSSGALTLHWTPPNLNNVGSWLVEQENPANPNNPWTLFPTQTNSTTSYTVTGLSNAQSYTFQVIAVSANGNSVSIPLSISGTPSWANAGTPTFSLAAGIYAAGQTVTLNSTTSGATIYYTTDGSTPTTSSPSVASGGTITITQSETLKAISVASGYNNSPVASNIYQIIGTTEMVAAGDYHSLVLKSDGTVWATGFNFEGQLGNGSYTDSISYTQIPGLSGIVAIASEGYESLALDKYGHVWTWGNTSNGGPIQTTQIYSSATPVQVPGLSGIIAIAGGEFFNLALDINGNVWSWGDIGSSELGNGSTSSNNYVPARVETSPGNYLTGITSIACAGYTGIAAMNDGTVWVWGSDGNDELGDGSGVNSPWAKQVYTSSGPLTDIMSVAGGKSYSLALAGDGTVWGWGDESEGYLGNGVTSGNTANSHTGPVQVLNSTGGIFSGVASISSRGDHTLALKNDGTVWAWGENSLGQLGNATTSENSPYPVQVSNLNGIISIAAGYSHNVAIKNDESIWGWGYNGDVSELGTGGSTSQTSLPATVNGLSGITAIAGDKSHYLALQNGQNGSTLWTWNDTTPGLISNGTTVTGSASPVPVSGFTGMTLRAIACGADFSLALDNNGQVWAWGKNRFGQLGNGNNTDNQVPARVSTSSGVLSGIIAIACGAHTGMALDSSGHLWTWGYNYDGELGNGVDYNNTNLAAQIPSLSGITAISAGAYTAAAVGNGTVWLWGYDVNPSDGSFRPGGYGYTPVNLETPTGITAIAGNYYHILARDNNGRVWAWGENQEGELGNGTTTPVSGFVEVPNLTNVTQIGPGGDAFHSLALSSTGLWAWGDNACGQLGVGSFGPVSGSPSLTGSDSPVQVQGLNGLTIIGLAGGKYSTIALTSGGMVLQWGDNSYEPQGFSIPIPIADGQVPAISIVSGNNQPGASGAFLPNPLVVKVTNEGQPMQNASVTFSVSQGNGLVSTAMLGTTLPSMTVQTDSNGLAQIYLQEPLVANATSIVRATVNLASGPNSVSFTATTPVDNAAPASPANFAAISAGNGEIDLSWTNMADNATSIAVQQQNSNGTWSTIQTLDPSQDSLPVLGLTVGDTYNYQLVVSNAAGQTTTIGLPAPAQATSASAIPPRYVVIDLGANMTPVKLTNSGFVLLEDGTGSFSRWQNGAPVALTVPNNYSLSVATDITEDGTIVGEGHDPSGNSVLLTWYQTNTSPTVSYGINGNTATIINPFIDPSLTVWSTQSSSSVQHSWSLLPVYNFNLNESFYSKENDGYYGSQEIGSNTVNFGGYLWPLYDPDVGYHGVPLYWYSGFTVMPMGVNNKGTAACVHVKLNTSTDTETSYPYSHVNGSTVGQPVSVTGVSSTTTTYILSSNGASGGATLPFEPLALNNDNFILGLPQSDGPYNYCSGQSGSPVALPSGFAAGSFNAAHGANGKPAYQFLGTDGTNLQLVEMDPKSGKLGNPTNVTKYISASDLSNWSAFSYASYLSPNTFMPPLINDGGAIVGTATYTPKPTVPPYAPDPIAAGSHGVLLWPLPKYFLDQALTQPLDDWPATGSLLRSPKHVLAQGDNIYIRVQGPPGLGNSAVTVTVTSDSDATGISVPLAEISPGVYSDQSPALPLQLGTTTGTVSTGTTPSAYTIKVIDKEVLKFNFNLNGIKFTGSDVMVLRGKFASCGINVFYAATGGDQSPLRTQAIGNAKFFSAGDGAYDDNVVSEGNPMATFIQNAGDGSDGQAVWLHISSHGGPAGDLSDNDHTVNRVYEGLTFTQGAGTPNAFTWTHNVTPIFGGAIIAPGNIDTSAHWNKDLEWVVLASCDQLNVDGGGFAAWQPILTGSPRSIHGILGAYNELSGDLQDQINDFWNRMQNSSSPEYVIDAYGTAMEDANSTAQPYAMLLDQANIDDKLKTVTQDSNAGSKFLFLNVDTIIEGRVGSSLDTPVYGLIDNGNGLVRTAWPSVSGVNVSGQKKLSAPLPLIKIKHLAFARKTSESSNGKQDFLGKRFTETLNYQTSLSKQQAADLARNYLSQQFPEFASRLKLKAVSERESGSLSSNGKASPSANGYLVQFSVLSEGIPVWGNFVNVSLQGDQIEAVHFLCNQDIEPTAQNTVQPLDAPSSLTTALPDIKNALGIKSQYEVFKAELFYVNRSTAQGLAPNLASDFIPAWHLVINKSYGGPSSTRDLHEVWIDAVTGKLLGHKRY